MTAVVFLMLRDITGTHTLKIARNDRRQRSSCASHQILSHADDFVILCVSVQRTGSMESITGELNRTLKGWFGYFRHSRWTIFNDLEREFAGD
jgi:hypothetical protein